ncbi:BHLH domain-containing protein [Forsythia ovata]|uniref:BHLH domain-containing protein n=1 Tax=Forsythia ovata TaxID=205694 RepID=A0ABD1P6R4_9LAMI
MGEGTPCVGGNVVGKKGEVSFIALGEDQEETDDGETPCSGRDPPLPYPDGWSSPATVQEQTPSPLLFLEPSLCYDPNGFFVQGFLATEIENLKMPKIEQQLFNVNSVSSDIPQYNFFSKTMTSVAESDVIYPWLPGLISLELPQYNHFQLGAESSSSKNPVELASIATDSERRSYHQHRFDPYMSLKVVAPLSTMARLKWQRISDKTRCLQKLLS